MTALLQKSDDWDVFESFFEQMESKAMGKLSMEERVQIREKMREKSLGRREYLLHEGDISRSVGFLVCGAARIFSVDERGVEHNIGFFVEGDWIIDYESFYCQTGSKYNIEVLENSRLLLLNFSDYVTLTVSLPLFREAFRIVGLEHYLSCLRRLHGTISLSAQERYEDFRQRQPAFIHRFPQAMIASFLGVTAETLCRVRRQVKPLFS